MSKKHKRSIPANQSGQSRPGEPRVSNAVLSQAEEVEPVAERRPIPVFLIVLLVVLVYLGDMYIMDHGADVMGKAGPFPRQVFDPFTTYQEVVAKNPESPE